jgi:hypothetical protein
VVIGRQSNVIRIPMRAAWSYNEPDVTACQPYRRITMPTEEKTPFITRRELNPILGMICLLIAVAFLGNARHDQTILLLIADYIFFGIAIFMSVTLNVWGLIEQVREKRRRMREISHRAEASPPADRPGD